MYNALVDFMYVRMSMYPASHINYSRKIIRSIKICRSMIVDKYNLVNLHFCTIAGFNINDSVYTEIKAY
jgi:hypothetical protein